MFSTNLKRSAATLGVTAGLLAAAGPASAQGGGADFTRLVDKAPAVTMLDYEGTPLFDNTPLDEVVFSARTGAIEGNPGSYMVDVIWQGYANPADKPASGSIEQYSGPEW